MGFRSWLALSVCVFVPTTASADPNPGLPQGPQLRRGNFVGLGKILGKPTIKRGRAAQLAGDGRKVAASDRPSPNHTQSPPNLRDVRVGTWDSWTNSALTITHPVGRYATRDEALRAGQRHLGPAVVLRTHQGYDVYGLNDHRRVAMTLDRVEQIDGYSVTDLTTDESEIGGRFSAIVTEDGAVLKQPGRFSGGHYTVDRPATLEVWTAERSADLAFHATAGMRTDDEALWEALANIPVADRPGFPRLFAQRHGVNLKARLDASLSDALGDRTLADHMLQARHPIYTRSEMARDLRAALDAYRSRHGRFSLRDSSSIVETPALTTYLASFAATNTEEQNAGFRTGHEYALKLAIARERERLGERLNPGQVFGLALELHAGDTYLAMLTSHNTIRALARGLDEKLNEQVPAGPARERDTFGSRTDLLFMEANLQPIRGGNDESGAWYHLFGVATMAMVGGKATAEAMSYGEEFIISGDAKTDPLELYIDLIGVEMGGLAGQ